MEKSAKASAKDRSSIGRVSQAVKPAHQSHSLRQRARPDSSFKANLLARPTSCRFVLTCHSEGPSHRSPVEAQRGGRRDKGQPPITEVGRCPRPCARLLTGMRSGYFSRIREASCWRFSSECSALNETIATAALEPLRSNNNGRVPRDGLETRRNRSRSSSTAGAKRLERVSDAISHLLLFPAPSPRAPPPLQARRARRAAPRNALAWHDRPISLPRRLLPVFAP
jgi:hypothetical protein